MEKENKNEGGPIRNRRMWILLSVLIVIIVGMIAYGAIIAQQENNANVNALEQQNNQLQANQNELQQQNSQLQTNQNQLQQNQLQQQCEAVCVSQSHLFSTTTWEYCSNTLGCRTFPTQQACVNSCTTNP